VKGLSVVRGVWRMATLAGRPSSLFGKVDRQFLLPHKASLRQRGCLQVLNPPTRE